MPSTKERRRELYLKNAKKIQKAKREEYARNSEKYKERQRRWNREHREEMKARRQTPEVKARRLAYMDEYRKRPEVITRKKILEERDRKKNTQRKNDYSKTPRGRFTVYRNVAKRRGLDFLITLEQFLSLLQSHCHYCGTSEKVGIDRKENDKGYTTENSLPCCEICNRMKLTQSYGEFLKRCRDIVKLHQ